MISRWGNYPELDSAGRPGVGHKRRSVERPGKHKNSIMKKLGEYQTSATYKFKKAQDRIEQGYILAPFIPITTKTITGGLISSI